MSQRLIDITDDFEQATSNLEQQVLDRVYRAFDAALRDTRRQIREFYPRLQEAQAGGRLTLLNRQALIAQELADYLKLLKPEQAEQMDALLSELLQQSTENGQRLAEALTKEIDPDYDMAPFVQVPLDAVIAQARTFRERLFRYSDQEASQISAVVEQGLVQGWDIRRTELQLNQLGVRFKSNAETVALTETMSAYNRGAMDRYQRSGLELVQWTVTPSERLCRYCLARNMKVYRVDEVVYPIHPRCLPGNVLVAAPSVKAGTSRQYRGEVVCIETASGKKLTATPNHPVLTDKGWIPLNLVKEGDHVFSCFDAESAVAAITPDDYQSPALISEITAALRESSGVSSVSVKVSPVDFHGDGKGSEVCVISTNSLLGNSLKPQVIKPLPKLPLRRRLVGALKLLTQGLSAFSFPGQGFTPAAYMGVPSLPSLLLRRHSLPLQPLCLGCGTDMSARVLKDSANSPTLNTKSLGNSLLRFPRNIQPHNFVPDGGVPFAETLPSLSSFDSLNLSGRPLQASLLQDSPENAGVDSGSLSGVLDRLAGKVFRDRIVKLWVTHFDGPVYNLETQTGWYFANDILTHNCRCALMPWSEEWQEQGLTDDAFAEEYRERTLKELRAEGVEPDNGLAPFEKDKLDQPPEPVWSP